MPEFGSPFSGLANKKKLTDEERVNENTQIQLQNHKHNKSIIPE
jgi:hypothetical protein